MDLPSLESILGPAAGVGGGALTVGWIAKLLITRFLEQNDKKHSSHSKRYELATAAINRLGEAHRISYQALSEKLAALGTDLAVIKSRIGEVMAVREDVTKNIKDIAVAFERIEGNSEDIDEGFSSIRQQMRNTQQELSDLKRLKPVGG